jgi:predicted nucleotidyltransferase
MHPEILRHKDAIAELCRRFGVTRLEVFGSAARGEDFDPARSDVDLLVEFGPGVKRSFGTLLGFEDAAAAVLGRRVDLVEFEAVAENRNPLKRRSILADAQPLYPP